MTDQNLAEKYRKLVKERMPVITTAHDDTGHFYLYNGQKYPSVTGALKMLKDEGLMNWKMNKACEYLLQAINNDDPRVTGKVNLEELIGEAKMVPVKEFEGAGDIGTKIHDWREGWFRNVIAGNLPEYPSIANITELPVVSGVRAIIKFKEESGYIPVACEMFVADEDLKIGGTLDDLGILNGKLVLVDLKTSNIGDKTSYFLQVALYYYMFRKLTGIRCQEFYILHVSKVDGTYKLIPIKNMSQLVKDAKLLLKLNASITRIVEEKKKVPIII